MRRTLIPVVTIASFALLLFAAWSSGGGVEKVSTRLPGARPDIDAALFPNLQAAFDALPAEGGLVRLPAGTFEIEQPLVLSRSDVLIQGAGTATHIKNVNTEGKPAILIQHADGQKVKDADRLWRVMLSNFRITGNEKSGHGIEALFVNEIFIQGVTVSYHGGDGIRLDSCYEDPRVSDCLMTYNKATGLDLLGCHDIVVSANQFEENHDALHCFDGFNLCMTGNCLDDHLGHGVVIENTYGSVVSGNMIEECNGTAIILDRDCYGNTLSSNIIAHDGGGIDLRDAHGCAVSANTFTIMKADALRIGPKKRPHHCHRQQFLQQLHRWGRSPPRRRRPGRSRHDTRRDVAHNCLREPVRQRKTKSVGGRGGAKQQCIVCRQRAGRRAKRP